MIIVNCSKHGPSPGYIAKGKDETNVRYRCNKCNVDAVKRRRKRIKQLSVEYKGGKCERCGYNKCHQSMDFHHLDPQQKDFAIARNGHTRSWARVKIELDKCILVCKNCHGEIHNELGLENE